jgi:hypothetical protein
MRRSDESQGIDFIYCAYCCFMGYNRAPLRSRVIEKVVMLGVLTEAAIMILNYVHEEAYITRLCITPMLVKLSGQ